MLFTEWNLKDALEVAKEEALAMGMEKGVAIGREEGMERILEYLKQGHTIA
jgi:hypothetical protein